MPTNKFVERSSLLALIGQQVTYRQHLCEIIELLDDDMLILRVSDEATSIQMTQHGEGHREVPTTFTLPVFDGEGNFHPEVETIGITALLFIDIE